MLSIKYPKKIVAIIFLALAFTVLCGSLVVYSTIKASKTKGTKTIAKVNSQSKKIKPKPKKIIKKPKKISVKKPVVNKKIKIAYKKKPVVHVKRTTVQAKRTVTNVKNPRVAYTNSDFDLLARLITAEGDGEPFNAKVAVGSVIVNRIKSHIFASTIRGVIYQRMYGYYQFTPVLNGWINKPATDESKKAAYLALNGKDMSRGALYYFDNSTKNTWLWSKQIKTQIGKLVFAY